MATRDHSRIRWFKVGTNEPHLKVPLFRNNLLLSVHKVIQEFLIVDSRERRLSNNWNSPEVLLIARRSSNYAGTRFNRRGQDFKGNVANDVETEQLVYQRGQRGEITSFVQHRGSIPIFWYQDMGSVPQKPPIELGHRDPWYQATGEHFKGLIGRYGSPIIAFNLVKKHSPGESDLGFEYKMAIEYLNQFLDEKIDWRWTDIAKLRKSGQFGDDFNDECRQVARHVGISSSKKKQNGVVRVNCVDCLDRTNLTQVNIGLVALQDQLGGVFSHPDRSSFKILLGHM